MVIDERAAGSATVLTPHGRLTIETFGELTSDEALAEPTFKLGVYFYEDGDETRARTYWERAQALSPNSWNFHRQDWNLTEGLAGPKLREKMGALGSEPFYEPLDLPADR